MEPKLQEPKLQEPKLQAIHAASPIATPGKSSLIRSPDIGHSERRKFNRDC
jgi:hypothetical protein